MRGNPFAFASDMVSGRPHVVARSLYSFPKEWEARLDEMGQGRGNAVVLPPADPLLSTVPTFPQLDGPDPKVTRKALTPAERAAVAGRPVQYRDTSTMPRYGKTLDMFRPR